MRRELTERELRLLIEKSKFNFLKSEVAIPRDLPWKRYIEPLKNRLQIKSFVPLAHLTTEDLIALLPSIILAEHQLTWGYDVLRPHHQMVGEPGELYQCVVNLNDQHGGRPTRDSLIDIGFFGTHAVGTNYYDVTGCYNARDGRFLSKFASSFTMYPGNMRKIVSTPEEAVQVFGRYMEAIANMAQRYGFVDDNPELANHLHQQLVF